MTQLIIAAFLAGVACQLLTCVSSFSAFHTFICLSSYLYDTSVCVIGSSGAVGRKVWGNHTVTLGPPRCLVSSKLGH